MIQPKKSFTLAAFFIFCLSVTHAFAQTPPVAKPSEPSFDVILQTVVASNEAGGKSDAASSLSGIVKKLKTDFSFSNYRLTSTAFQKISNRGNLEFSSVSYLIDSTEKKVAVFSDYGIYGLETFTSEQGQETIQIQNFKFGQRVPIINANTGAIGYERTALSTKFGLVKNTPTIIGSLTTTKPDELMFLILTVKSSEK